MRCKKRNYKHDLFYTYVRAPIYEKQCKDHQQSTVLCQAFRAGLHTHGVPILRNGQFCRSVPYFVIPSTPMFSSLSIYLYLNTGGSGIGTPIRGSAPHGTQNGYFVSQYFVYLENEYLGKQNIVQMFAIPFNDTHTIDCD